MKLMKNQLNITRPVARNSHRPEITMSQSVMVVPPGIIAQCCTFIGCLAVLGYNNSYPFIFDGFSPDSTRDYVNY